MKVLVTGANGFVGTQLCALLKQTGHYARGTVRTVPSAVNYEPVVVGSLEQMPDWSAALAGIETVVHLAARVHILNDTAPDPLAAFRAANAEATQKLVQQAREAGVRRFVYVSSAKVHGEITWDRPFNETDAPQPSDAYAVSKWEGEQALVEAAHDSLDYVILRPPLVYGPHVRGNFLRLLSAVKRRIPLPLGAVRNRRSLLYVGNLAAAILRCLEHPAALRRVFLITDGEDFSTPELIRVLAQAMGLPPRLLPVPPVLLRVAAHMLGRRGAAERLTRSLQLDSASIRGALGWSPPFAAREALASTARWYNGGANS
jgi:nucleoside-diphosphate-sugar epimerase